MNETAQHPEKDTLPKAYEFAEVEQRWYARWLADETFSARMDEGKPAFSIVIPPPNVTGVLHIGHALNNTLQDLLVRYHRMRGDNTLWVPGTDHAGIATQNVVERQLASENLSRHDLGRDKFIERVWAWRAEKGGTIINQLKRMGASCDWERERFTMDEGLSRAVREVFVRLYKEGLIYKGDYIVNWCPRCHTALADDEVEHDPTDGKLYHIRYPYADGSGSVVVATTRPETMLGDTAVAVHPDDERYQHLAEIGISLPLTGRTIPVVFDHHVQREFGTGALKVTPAHDRDDYEIGLRHDLPRLKVMDDKGVMNEAAGSYAGLDRFACRKKIVSDLQEQGFLERIEDYQHAVGKCYRCATVVEPTTSKQWFVSVRPLADKAVAAVQEGRIKLYPNTWYRTFYSWMENIRDWCISRQIWWGHRIPAWTCPQCGELIVVEEYPTACPKCGCTALKQEEDVLDTWFSSALWPFSTMGWPEQTKDLARYYPTSVLVTGFDILFFWVARMMMMGTHFMKEVPFHHVYLHALVRDATGRKMSKSTGNVIDPLEMIDKYGCDALRFTLTSFAAMGRDIRLAEERIEGYRHFVNKLWNAARFALINLPEEAPAPVDLGAMGGLHHQWILHRLEIAKKEMDSALEEYRFNDAAQLGYKFLWNEFCDWYLELIKPDMQDEARKPVAQYALWTVLREDLLLLHPMMPFVTAEIWQALPGGAGQDLALELYPAARPQCEKPAEAARMEFIQETIVAVRTIRSELNISPSLRLKLLLHPVDAAPADVLEASRQLILTLARLDDMTVGADVHAPKASASHVVQGCQVIVPLEGAVDFEAELARLDKELAKIVKDLEGLQKRLANESFTSRAPKDVVEKERARAESLLDAKHKLDALKQRFTEAMQG